MVTSAAKLEAVDAKGAQQLREQAAGIREGYRGIAAAKAGVELASEFILPEHKLLAAGMGGAMKRVGVNTLKSLGEGAAAEIGGQAVNAAVYGDDFDLGQIARGAALEAAAGAPMIATSAFAPDQATHAQPSRAEAADSLPQDPDSMPATIGGRQSLITPTAAEAAQIATMRPGYTEAALATAPRSMLDIAVSAGRASDPASPSPISDPPSPNEAGVTDGSSTNAQPGSPASNVLDDAGSTPAAGATPQPTASPSRLQFSKSGAREFIDMATAKARMAVGNLMGRVELGTLTARAASMIQQVTGIQAVGTRVNLNLEAWHHADKKHGSGSNAQKEASKHRDQIPLVSSDIDLVAPVALDPDAVGLILNSSPQIRASQDASFVPEKEDFSIINVKEVGDHFIVATTLPNYNGVANVRSVYKRKVRQGMRAEDVLQEVLQDNASKAHRALTQDQIAQLWQKRQVVDAARVQRSAASVKPVKATPKSVTDALTLLKARLTGLLNNRVLTFANAAEFLSSGYAREGSFTAAETAGMQDAEAFYDTLTGHTIVFTGQITLREGETPIRAVARVLLHERVGHDGLNTLLAQDARAAARWSQLAAQIPAAELDAIAAEAGYTHLATDRAQLALEWLARQVESVEGARNAAAIERSLTGTAKQLWQALKEMLAKVFANFSREAAFTHEVHEIITLARAAALTGTADPTTPEGLVGRVQFSLPPLERGTPQFSRLTDADRDALERFVLKPLPSPAILRHGVGSKSFPQSPADAVRRLAGSLAADGHVIPGLRPAVTAGQPGLVGYTAAELELAERFAALFGRRIVIVESDTPLPPFNGVNHRGIADTIFVHAQTTQSQSHDAQLSPPFGNPSAESLNSNRGELQTRRLRAAVDAAQSTFRRLGAPITEARSEAEALALDLYFASS